LRIDLKKKKKGESLKPQGRESAPSRESYLLHEDSTLSKAQKISGDWKGKKVSEEKPAFEEGRVSSKKKSKDRVRRRKENPEIAEKPLRRKGERK